MKSVEEIQAMLVSELWNSLNRIRSNTLSLDYYNEIMGDTSFLLAGLLEGLLRKEIGNWNFEQWIDDSLLTMVELDENQLLIGGVMIWGLTDTTEQWTEPFCFTINLDQDAKGFSTYIFEFGDSNKHEISYTEFKKRRNYWDQIKRDWKYTIKSKVGNTLQ